MSFWKTQLVNKEAKPKAEITQSGSKTLNMFEECTLNAVVRRELRTLLDEEYRQRKLVRYEDLDDIIEKALTLKLTTLMELNTKDRRERMEQNEQQHGQHGQQEQHGNGAYEQMRVSPRIMSLPSCYNVKEEPKPQCQHQHQHQNLQEEQGACVSILNENLLDSDTQTLSCFQLSDKEDNKTLESKAVSRTMQKVKNRFSKRIQKLQKEHGERIQLRRFHQKNLSKRSSNNNHNRALERKPKQESFPMNQLPKNKTCVNEELPCNLSALNEFLKKEQLFSFRPASERKSKQESLPIDQLPKNQNYMEEKLPCNLSALDEFLQNRQCSIKEQMPTTNQWPTVDQLMKNCCSLKKQIMENQLSKVEKCSKSFPLSEKMLGHLYSKGDEVPKKKFKMMEHNPKNHSCMKEHLPKIQSSMMAHLPEHRWSMEHLSKNRWSLVKQMRQNRSRMLENISKSRHLMADKMAKDKQLQENRNLLEAQLPQIQSLGLPKKKKSIGVMEELSKNRWSMVNKLQKNRSKIMKQFPKNPKPEMTQLFQNQQLIGDGLINNQSSIEHQLPMEDQQGQGFIKQPNNMGEQVKVVVEKKTFATIKLPKWEAEALLTSQTGDQMMDNIYTRFKEKQQCALHPQKIEDVQNELELKKVEYNMKNHLLMHQKDASQQLQSNQERQVANNIDKNNLQNTNLKTRQQKSNITMNAANLCLVSPPSHSFKYRSRIQTKPSSAMFMRGKKGSQGC